MNANPRLVSRGATGEIIDNLRYRAGLEDVFYRMDAATLDEICDEICEIIADAIKECAPFKEPFSHG